MTFQVAPGSNPDLHLRTLATAKDPQTRQQAANILLQMGYSFPQIVQMALAHKTSQLRLWGVVALGQSNELPAVKLLIPMIKDPNPKVRQTVIKQLSQFNDPEAREAVARYQRKSRRANMIPMLVIVGVLAVLGTGFLVTQLVRGSQADPFKNNLADYISSSAFKEQFTATPYIKGKLVVVNQSEVKVDDPYFDLPEDIKALKPEEVGTIVWVSYEPVVVGRYTGGSAGYRYTGKVTVIDKTAGAIVGRTSFKGGEPPSTKRGSGDAYGSKPTEEIKNYLLSLPRK